VNQLVGADPAALRDLSDLLHSKAHRLHQMQESTSGFVVSLAWEGAVAEDFLTVWSFAHGPKFEQAAAFLTQAAETLARNAAEQRTTSRETDGSADALTSLGYAQALEDRLLSAGFSLGAAEISMLLNTGNKEFIDWFVDQSATFKNLSKVVGGGSLLSDFLKDAAEHNALPFDERVVHAVGETALKYASDKGISQAMQWGGAALVALFTAGAGALAGRAVGWLAGEGLGALFSHYDDKRQLTDKGADALTEIYRNVRDDPEPYLRAVPFAGSAMVGAPQTWDLATNLVPRIGEVGSHLTDAASDAQEQVENVVSDIRDTTTEIIDTRQPAMSSTW
jgi:hypothetical protein